MGMTVQEWYAAAEKMTITEHLRMQKAGDPIIRSALREIVNQEGGKFGQVKERFLDGEMQTVCLVLAQIESLWVRFPAACSEIKQKTAGRIPRSLLRGFLLLPSWPLRRICILGL